MENNFITREQAQDVELVKNIVKPAVGNISSITPCAVEACNSHAFLINNHLIAKFAKNEASRQKLFFERDILSFLRGKTTLKIPENNIFENHFTFTLHEMIKGDTLSNKQYQMLAPQQKEKFCSDIALFIHELHSLTNETKNLNLPQLKGITKIYPIDKVKSILIESQKFTPQE